MEVNKAQSTGRISLAEQNIKQCFLQMLKSQPVERINVGRLCERAGVNRSTFYRHFVDIYALLDSVVSDCLHELFTQPVSAREISGVFEELGYEAILNVCRITKEKKDLYRMLLFGRTNTQLIPRMTDAFVGFYMQAHAPISGYRPSDVMELQYQLLAHGVIGMWAAWMEGGCLMPEEKVAAAVKGQISAFFLHMNDLYP